jgi:hypothetical protein
VEISPKHVEQFTDINKLYIVASRWTIIDIHTFTDCQALDINQKFTSFEVLFRH